MGRLGKQVEGLDSRERVAAIGKGAYVPGQGRGIAGEVDDARVGQAKDLHFKKYGGAN